MSTFKLYKKEYFIFKKQLKLYKYKTNFSWSVILNA